MNILLFGDSITWGACDNECGGWATRLRNHLAPRDIDVYNCGISGDNTDDLLKRFDVEAEARKSEDSTVIVFAIGINDSQYTDSRDNARVPKDRFVSNLDTLVASAKKLSDQVLFIGLTHVEENKVMPIPWSDENQNYDNTNIDLYDSYIKAICDKHQMQFLSVLNLLSYKDLEDGLHPNTEGHRKMLKAIESFVTANI